MKKIAQQGARIRGLSSSSQQQLNSYALAAAAAGVSVLALANHCEAKIIYTPTHHVIGNSGSYGLDFDNEGTPDLTIQNKRTYTTSEGPPVQLLAAKMSGSNQVVGNFFGAVAMKPGMWIGPKCTFGGGTEQMARVYTYISDASGSWVNVKNRYLGVKFYITGKVHYGWARLNVHVQFPRIITATLTGYAYETVANKPIVAGQTKDGSDAALPGPDLTIPADPDPSVAGSAADEPGVVGSLGSLARGAAGSSLWRRKELPLSASDLR
jgi:hypothetical protein